MESGIGRALGALTELGPPVPLDPAATITQDQVLARRLAHEYDRTRRYGHELSCVVIRTPGTTGRNMPNSDMDLSVVVGDIVSSCIRSTDELFCLADGVYVVIAPETMHNRVVTLKRRISTGLQDLLRRCGDAYLDFTVHIGSFSFNGRNAGGAADILQKAIDASIS